MGYPITIDEFKTFFAKDFDYGTEITQVSDVDISKAMVEAGMNFNEKLFDCVEEKKIIFSYLTAYYLVVDINNANTQGASNNGGLVTYRQVRNVAESFKVPNWVSENPMLSQFAQNGYGLKYIT
ncbi:MAG: hypothetical protein SPL29_05750, partial [Bacteroidales bacterium]|nr:hypothetical protein [Bacteroidales bacterium]